jgi:hypothetical protein
MDEIWWYLTRSTGIVATGLAAASLVLGAFFSARNTGHRRSPAWWLDLHNYLGGLALVFTGAHVLASLLDPGSGIRLVDALVPGTAAGSRWAMAWGVLAMYTFIAAVFTSWPRRLRARRAWRIIHLTSVAGVALSGIHGLMLGSDSNELAFRGGVVVGAMIVAYAITLRAVVAATKRTAV